MPLRDHFRPPLDDIRRWEGFHATWPVKIVELLRHKLPRRYHAEPRVHSGSSAEIRCPLRVLQAEQASQRFASIVGPPRTCGIR